MNSITITGNLGRDCELRFLPDGKPVASFSVADNQGKDKPSIWWRCSLFGPRAESISQYLTKGQQVTVIGSITEREYQDKDGTPRRSMDIRVNDVALQGGRRDDAGQQGGNAQQPQRQAPQGGYAQPPQRQAPQGGYAQPPQRQAPQGGYDRQAPHQAPQGSYQQAPQRQAPQRQAPAPSHSSGFEDMDSDIPF